MDFSMHLNILAFNSQLIIYILHETLPNHPYSKYLYKNIFYHVLVIFLHEEEEDKVEKKEEEKEGGQKKVGKNERGGREKMKGKTRKLKISLEFFEGILLRK